MRSAIAATLTVCRHVGLVHFGIRKRGSRKSADSERLVGIGRNFFLYRVTFPIVDSATEQLVERPFPALLRPVVLGHRMLPEQAWFQVGLGCLANVHYGRVAMMWSTRQPQLFSNPLRK